MKNWHSSPLTLRGTCFGWVTAFCWVLCISLLTGCDLAPPAPVTSDTRPVTQARAQAIPGPPNIVFVMVDDLGWGDVGFNGSEINTPSIDKLAASGIRLDRYYSYAICSPTRAALLTGRTAFESGVDGPIALDAGLPLTFTLLPERLKQHGYETALVGKWHLGAAATKFFPNQRGFDHFYGILHGFTDHYTHLTPRGELDWQRNGKTVREEGYSTDLLTREAIRIIKGRDKTRPLFLFLSYTAPHTPVQAPAEFVERYAHIEDPVRRTYAGMVEAMDAGLSRVLEALETEGMMEETVIVWTSDNGGNESGGADNGHFRGGKATAFEGGVRVPALINWRGVTPAGVRVDLPTSVHDWFPTFLQLAGESHPDQENAGRSLVPLLTGGSHEPVDIVVGARRPARPLAKAVIDGPWKLVRPGSQSLESSDGDGQQEQEEFLFNVIQDPGETADLALKYPEIRTRLAKVLDELPAAPSLTEPVDQGEAGSQSGPDDPMKWLRGYTEEIASPAAEAASRD